MIEFDWYGFLVNRGLDVAYSLMSLLIGLFVIRIIRGRLRDVLKKKVKDPTALLFVVNIAYGGMLLVLAIIVLTKLGVPSASLLTVLGAGSLAIGLALKDSLTNISSGILLIFLRPFRIGNTVEAGSVFGTVEQINLFTTQIKTANNQVCYVPNKNIMNGRIDNYSERKTRRVDLSIGISYGSDLSRAKVILQNLFEGEKRILKDPKPFIGVKDLADSAVVLCVRPWVKTPDYWPVLCELQEKIKLKFDEEGIEIPFPQMDINVQKQG
jgi:small conductance mechanosensitive channel